MIPSAPGVRAEASREAVLRAAPHDHIVQFYESDEFLTGVVSGFLAAGLRAGQPVLAIVNARRREALGLRLRSVGIDAERAARAGQLALLDAEEVLSKVMVGGEPRWDRFRLEVGEVVERLGGGAPGRKLRAYGELVDVLWRGGDRGGALRIEEMWEHLASTHALSVLCAYALGSFEEEAHGRRIQDVCAAHGYVVPAESWVEVGDGDARLREVVRLQQRARALQHEIERRRELEGVLREALQERKRLEERLRAQNEALSRAVHLSEAFVGMLGHDLRNPLNAIATAAALLAQRAPSEEISRPATRIVRSARRMARMIAQILDFTRIRLGKGLPLEPREIDLADVCRHAADELEGESTPPRVRLETRGDVVGRWDADRLAQLVSNLVGNALVHGSAGTPVSIRLDGTRAQEVSLEVENGGAIRPDVLPGIFEPFASAPGPSGAVNGLGLGLHISRQIALAHGGSIDVASSDEDGRTRFTVRLPRSPTEPRRASPAPPAP